MNANNNWPFDAWLKLAVRGFRLSPSEFWAMSLRDWLALTRADELPTMSAEALSALQLKFPDEIQKKEVSYDTD